MVESMPSAGKLSVYLHDREGWQGEKFVHEIVDGLFLSALRSTDVPSEMDTMGVTHILSLGV